ncbi:MAG: DUF934 domain-containing protein [Defluviicoccus sp.]|nr:DUF934 domain-containing protein [Defluviicoccus sp.]MDE0274374.1 DUF934 domain-containing protein [Defluviicoccus sp.]
MGSGEANPEAQRAAPAPARPAQTRASAGNALESARILVRDTGFEDDDWQGEFIRWTGADPFPALSSAAALDLENTAQAEDIAPAFGRIALIRIAFPSHTDGRGFSLARHLRLLGYRGRLRAAGRILADQYAMARRSGFDEVEIDRALAEQQPEEQWLFRADWRSHDYQKRLGRRPRRALSVAAHRRDTEAPPAAPRQAP